MTTQPEQATAEQPRLLPPLLVEQIIPYRGVTITVQAEAAGDCLICCDVRPRSYAAPKLAGVSDDDSNWQLQVQLQLGTADESKPQPITEQQVEQAIRVAKAAVDTAYYIQEQQQAAAGLVCDPRTAAGGEGYRWRGCILEFDDVTALLRTRQHHPYTAVAYVLPQDAVAVRQQAFSRYADDPLTTAAALGDPLSVPRCALALYRRDAVRGGVALGGWLARLDPASLWAMLPLLADCLVITPAEAEAISGQVQHILAEGWAEATAALRGVDALAADLEGQGGRLEPVRGMSNQVVIYPAEGAGDLTSLLQQHGFVPQGGGEAGSFTAHFVQDIYLAAQLPSKLAATTQLVGEIGTSELRALVQQVRNANNVSRRLHYVASMTEWPSLSRSLLLADVDGLAKYDQPIPVEACQPTAGCLLIVAGRGEDDGKYLLYKPLVAGEKQA